MGKTPKKDQGEKDEENKPQEGEKRDEARPEYEELVQRISVIAKPLAGRKLTKRLYKTVKKGQLISRSFLILTVVAANNVSDKNTKRTRYVFEVHCEL